MSKGIRGAEGRELSKRTMTRLSNDRKASNNLTMYIECDNILLMALSSVPIYMLQRIYLSKTSKRIDIPILIKVIANNLQAQLKMKADTGSSKGSASAPGKQNDFATRLAGIPSQSMMQRYIADDLSSVSVSDYLYAKHQAESHGDSTRKTRCARGIEVVSACKAPQGLRMPRFDAQSPSYGRFSAMGCPEHQLKAPNQDEITSKSAKDKSSSIRTELSETVSRRKAVVGAKVSSVGKSKQQGQSDSTK